jgi:hypothetical protein
LLGTPGHATWTRRPEADLRTFWSFDEERPLATDGWSGAAFSEVFRLERRQRLILKRTSPAVDWIVRATRDEGIREATLPSLAVAEIGALGRWVSGLFGGFLDAARGEDGSAVILQDDLDRALGGWQRTDGTVLSEAALDHLLDRIAVVHTTTWGSAVEAGWARQGLEPAWCPLPERLTLLTRRSAAGYSADDNPVGPIFQRGWDAFEHHAPRAALDLIDGLADDPSPLVAALSRLPSRGLHGDLKLANAASTGTFIDWQMMLRAPVAVDLGWFLVANSTELPLPPDATLDRYLDAVRRWSGREGGTRVDALDVVLGDWEAQVDLAMIVGLLLRGWRKGRDTDDGVVLGSGVTAADDLAWWCRRALEAAGRRL